jgi:hypothetical protein
MYPASGDQHNFFNATQGVDTLVSAFDAAVSSLSLSDDADEAYVYASDYNVLVDKFNRLAYQARWLQQERVRLLNENARMQRLLNAGRK